MIDSKNTELFKQIYENEENRLQTETLISYPSFFERNQLTPEQILNLIVHIYFLILLKINYQF